MFKDSRSKELVGTINSEAFSCGSECSSGFCPEPTALHHCVRGSTKGVSGKINTLKFRNGEEWPAN